MYETFSNVYSRFEIVNLILIKKKNISKLRILYMDFNNSLAILFLKIFIYLFLAVLGLSCGMWYLSLQCTGSSLVVAHGLLCSCGTRAL